MLDREAEKPVGGPDKRVEPDKRLEMDDAYLGGARRGGKSRPCGLPARRPSAWRWKGGIEGHPMLPAS